MEAPSIYRYNLPTMLERVENLIIVAGPSCCGKSIFLKKLAAGELPKLSSLLGLNDFGSWLSIEANHVPQIGKKSIEKMVLHYALPCRQIHEGRFVGYDKDPQLSALKAAQNLSVVTLYADSATLSQRAAKRLWRWRLFHLHKLLSNPPYYLSMNRNLKLLRKLYEKPENNRPTYAQWFDFCRPLTTGESWIVEASMPYTPRPAEGWEKAFGFVDSTAASQ